MSFDEMLLELMVGDPPKQEEAFIALVEHYQRLVTNFVESKRLRTGDIKDSEDIIMETFASLWQTVQKGGLTLETNLEALLIDIAKKKLNEFYRYKDRQKRKPPTADDEANLLIEYMYGSQLGVDSTSTPLAIVEEELRKMADELGEIQRMVLLILAENYPNICKPKEVFECGKKMGYSLTYPQVKTALPEIFKKVRNRVKELSKR